MILYIKQGCPFGAKVLSASGELGITFEIRDIADSAVANELVKRGGKRQVPYLVDEETGAQMYESDD
jgi:glutaredoxin